MNTIAPTFAPDPHDVANHGKVSPPQREMPLFSSVYEQPAHRAGGASFGGSVVWAGNAVLGNATGYASIEDATNAAALLSRDAAGAVAVVASESGFVLHPALAGGYGDNYEPDAGAASGWDWVSGVRDGLVPLHLGSSDPRQQGLVKLLPWLGLSPGDKLLAYRTHAAGDVLLVDDSLRATLSTEFGLQVRPAPAS